ncbi:MAG: hypothetical protein QN157_07180 [Armatimonadota bacterium]|nr:hypothetical protein [Armatimonadota bacterium]
MDRGDGQLSPIPGLVLGAVLLLLAILPWPYGYYVFMRWIVVAASGYAAWVAYAGSRHTWTWILGAVAVLFNPVFPIHMRRNDWMVFDLVGAGLLGMAALRLRRSMTRDDRLGPRPANRSRP